MKIILFIVILIIFALPIFVAIFKALFGAKIKGKLGEGEVRHYLNKLPKETYHVFNNVMLVAGESTIQIDHVVVSPYGIFVIETKNYMGNIYGDDDRQEWTQIIKTEVRYWKSNPFKTYTYITKNHLYNPVKQNLAHVDCLRRLLGSFKFVPIVAFTEKASIFAKSALNELIYASQVHKYISAYNEVCLTDDEVKNCVEKLQLHMLDSGKYSSQHVRNIRKKKQVQETKISKGVCPQCGGALVYRKGKFGPFYGCSNYPRCKFTLKQ